MFAGWTQVCQAIPISVCHKSSTILKNIRWNPVCLSIPMFGQENSTAPFYWKTQNKSTTPWWLNTMVKHPMATFLIFSAQIQIKQIPDAWATSKPIGTSQNFMVGSREFTSTGWGSHPPTHYRPRWASATAIRNPSNLLSWCVVNPEPTIPVANQLDASSPLVEVYSRSWNLWKFHARILTLPLPQTTTYKQH